MAKILRCPNISYHGKHCPSSAIVYLQDIMWQKNSSYWKILCNPIASHTCNFPRCSAHNSELECAVLYVYIYMSAFNFDVLLKYSVI